VLSIAIAAFAAIEVAAPLAAAPDASILSWPCWSRVETILVIGRVTITRANKKLILFPVTILFSILAQFFLSFVKNSIDF
jgi:intracellular septation protein A